MKALPYITKQAGRKRTRKFEVVIHVPSPNIENRWALALDVCIQKLRKKKKAPAGGGKRRSKRIQGAAAEYVIASGDDF